MIKVHFISHTHWDREWYRTFQQFRFNLVRMVDKLLRILRSDKDYKYFMLDGQTILLQDYLAVRPERESELREHIESGRVLVGPWYCMPDEFLVSPEALIRNLMMGRKTAARFGPCMTAGYLPDSFGHIGQMPQLLAGFGLHSAVAWRGIGDQPCQLWWKGPDGTRVILAHLRESYSNAVKIPSFNDEATLAEAKTALDKLVPFTQGGPILLMQGTDHIEPRPEITPALNFLNQALPGYNFIHSTLPLYLADLQQWLDASKTAIPTITGELRHCMRQPVLPGTLSSRMWIKQSNHRCQVLLEKWAEPYSAIALLIASKQPSDTLLASPERPDGFTALAWRMLLENHAHDSICGCSVDQVHDEMRTRFDQVAQIAEAVAGRALSDIIISLDTSCPYPDKAAIFSVTVFNPLSSVNSGAVTMSLILSHSGGDIEILDGRGNNIPHQVVGRGGVEELLDTTLDWQGLAALWETAAQGSSHGIQIHDIEIERKGDDLYLDIIVDNSGQPALKAWQDKLNSCLTDTSIRQFHVRAALVRPSQISFIAGDVPPLGYATYWIQRSPAAAAANACANPESIENEYLIVSIDECSNDFMLTDKRTGQVYSGLNFFTDGGDRGDLYNYCAPADDSIIDSRQYSTVTGLRIESGPVTQSITLNLVMLVPDSLSPDRMARSAGRAPLEITTKAVLTRGIARVDFTTSVTNVCCDHRLRAHFTAPFKTGEAYYDGHFEVVGRPAGAPAHDNSWFEKPAAQQPQRAFVDISDGKTGLMVANRGLPEAEVLQSGPASEVALTLLRCIGWLSLDNLDTRKDHAGPPWMAVPDAQMHGTYEFEYSIVPHTDGWAGSFQQAYAFNAPMRAVVDIPHSGTRSGTGSFLTVVPDLFVIAAIKTPEDGTGLLVRGFNITGKAIKVRIKPDLPVGAAHRCRLDETIIDNIKTGPDGCIRFSAGAHEIVSLRFDTTR
ncbi:MAG: glycoside hydrolase family 38 C-terminal domain-containing protein [Dehalococcoidia bacterium]|jgi:alpha-mannosidase